jgi:hypothetical protein
VLVYARAKAQKDHANDIQVLIGYTATAGIVVLILVCHYHIAHDPTKDPFEKKIVSGATTSHNSRLSPQPNPRPNQIDVAYLSLLSKILAELRPRLNRPGTKEYPRVEAVFIKVGRVSHPTSYLR